MTVLELMKYLETLDDAIEVKVFETQTAEWTKWGTMESLDIGYNTELIELSTGPVLHLGLG